MQPRKAETSDSVLSRYKMTFRSPRPGGRVEAVSHRLADIEPQAGWQELPEQPEDGLAFAGLVGPALAIRYELGG